MLSNEESLQRATLWYALSNEFISVWSSLSNETRIKLKGLRNISELDIFKWKLTINMLGGLRHPLPPPKVLLKATLPHIKFWDELFLGKMAFFKKILTPTNDIFQKNIWKIFGFSQICTKILTPPLPLKIFLNSYPPP